MKLEMDEKEFCAEDEDYGYIDEEITRFTKDLSEKEPLDEIFKKALAKKKKLHQDDMDDILFDAQNQ